MNPEHRLAHPVADANLLELAPIGVRLLDQDWVLWRDVDGRPRAAIDRCPHRGARLSAGRVHRGELQCPYHGWRYDSTGQCTYVPALPAFVPPGSHQLQVASVAQAHGLLWLQPEGDELRMPYFPAELDDGLRKLNVGPFDVATSAPRVVENFLDMAHFGFVHGGLLGDSDHTAVPPHTASVDADGVHTRGCRAWQPRSNLRSAGGSWVNYSYDVPAPYTAVLNKAPDDQSGWRESIALFICPLSQEQSRVWFRLAVPPDEADEAALQAFQRTIFSQDQPLLEMQIPKRLPLVGAEQHTAADRSTVAYRRWLRDLGIRFGTC